MNIAKATLVACMACSGLVAACATSDPTTAVLVNAYPPAADAGAPDSRVVFKGWWAVAEFADPVVAGEESEPVRVVQGTDYGYALLAPGWDPSAGAAPTALIPLRSSAKLSVARGDTLSFVVSDATTLGNCAAHEPLSQGDADFITQRIFPAEFSSLSYDAATCTSSALSDAGLADAGQGGASDTAAGDAAGAP